MERNIALSILFSCALALPACASSAEDDLGDSSDAIVGAPIDNGHDFSVGVCQGPLNTDPSVGPVGTCRSGTAKCSGTLIGPNLVLTARHCVRGSDYGPNAATNPCDSAFNGSDAVAGGTRITTSPSVFVGTPKWYDVSEILVPQENGGCTHDVALLVLDENVPRSEARPVGVDVFRNVALHPPKELAFVGRGSILDTYELDANGDWTGGWTFDRGDLMKRIATNIPFVCASDGPTLCTTVDHEVPTTHVYTAPLEQFIIGGPGGGSGDSGAGIFDQRLFDRFGGRLDFVLGVATWAFIGPDGHGAPTTGVQRLDHLAGFLSSNARYAARKGHYRTPLWAILAENGFRF